MGDTRYSGRGDGSALIVAGYMRAFSGLGEAGEHLEAEKRRVCSGRYPPTPEAMERGCQIRQPGRGCRGFSQPDA